MAAQRAFYVTQGSLTVWHNGAIKPENGIVFADNDSGLRQFDEYLSNNVEAVSFVLADVIEEEFAQDKMPRLGFRDRKSLLERRVRSKFPRTQYRLPIYHGRESKSSGDDIVFHSAISNEELLDPWLQIMLRHEIPLTGIFSVPLMAPYLVAVAAVFKIRIGRRVPFCSWGRPVLARLNCAKHWRKFFSTTKTPWFGST